MQRIINDPNMVVEDMLKGFAKCHRDIIHVDEENPESSSAIPSINRKRWGS